MARETRSGVAFRPCRSGSSPSSTSSDSTISVIGSPGFGSGRAIVAHTIYGVDAVAAAQALSEIGYLLRQNEKERFRAKAFSAAAWSIALERRQSHDAGDGPGRASARLQVPRYHRSLAPHHGRSRTQR